MHYYVDGYNLIFSLIESKESLQSLRQKVVRLLQKRFALLGLQGTLVFDGSHRRDEESGLSYHSPLIVAYTPKGQSADEYIVERIGSSKNPKLATVVTNDRGLILHVASLGAKSLSNGEFIRWLKGKSKKKKAEEIEPKDSQKNIDRLLKIFEERLKEDSD